VFSLFFIPTTSDISGNILSTSTLCGTLFLYHKLIIPVLLRNIKIIQL
jgi:hypothetical protein